ncbi:hypothetical protein DMA11_00995 [Marinilabiliaceae bacterium JC017]|nr:hypothetical protein DMA11_00995 [Marinilabiliaceae bacterium JC017]
MIEDFFRSKKYLLLLLIVVTLPTSVGAQIDAFVRVRLNTQEVYIQQPVKVSITVYTATWFTQPLDMGNIQVTNAFVLPFKRTISGIQYVNKKKYASLEFFFLVFPYQVGDIVVSSMNIIAETPPEGDYKGQRISLKTKPVTIKVNPMPGKEEDEHWLVARDVTISENWNRPLKNLKIGDLIERTVTIRASGTLPAFIPESKIEQEDWACIYPREPELKDTRTTNDANGIRIQHYRYLLEKEGSFEVAPVEIFWWNPYLQKKFSRQTKPAFLTIHSNPDLGILTSMQDSLAAEVMIAEIDKADKISVLGLNPYELVLIFTIVVLAVVMVYKAGRFVWNKFLYKKEQYENSEARYFKDFVKALGQNEHGKYTALYAWLIRFNLNEDLFYTTKQFSGFVEDMELEEELKRFLEAAYANTQEEVVAVKRLKEMVAACRNELLMQKARQTGKKDSLDAFNP